MIFAKSFLVSVFLVLLSASRASGQERFDGLTAIQSVEVSPICFDPTRGEQVTVAYHLTVPASVSIRVYDPEGGLIRLIGSGELKPEGRNESAWDGRDQAGDIIPDEAYCIVVEATEKGGRRSEYDPIVISGGEDLEVQEITYDRRAKAVRFALEHPSRILLRAGITGGPLVDTVANWIPLASGRHSIPWSGRSSDGVLNVSDRNDLKFYGIGFRLPKATVLTTGNVNEPYAAYKQRVRRTQEVRSRRSRDGWTVRLSEHWDRALSDSHPVAFTLVPVSPSPSGEPLEISRIDGKAHFKLEIAPEDRPRLRGQYWEFLFYEDFELLGETEYPTLPYIYEWDISNLEPGEHILTVNLASGLDQVSSRSQRVIVR